MTVATSEARDSGVPREWGYEGVGLVFVFVFYVFLLFFARYQRIFNSLHFRIKEKS